MDLNSLKTDAGVIRDASQDSENTAFRVGSWLVNLIEFLTNTSIEAVMTGIVPAVTAEGIVLTLSFQKSDGSTFTKTITLPLADAEKAGLMSPSMINKLAALQSSIYINTTKNTEQDTAIAGLQSDVASIKSKNTTQDSQIQVLNTLVEQNVANVENVTNIANTNKSGITALQGDVSGIASDIASIQKTLVLHSQKDSEQDTAIASFDSFKSMQEEFNTTIENHISQTEMDYIGVSDADGKGSLYKRMIAAEASLKDIEDVNTSQDGLLDELSARIDTLSVQGATETYVLNFTIADGTNTGTFTETQYNELRQAIVDGKLIIIAGTATRNTADSQAMAADYVVIRYATPRINESGSVTLSVYELKFSASEYTSKAIHKTIS